MLNRMRKYYPVALLAVALCVIVVACDDDDDNTVVPAITTADFAGSWQATEYKVTSKTTPPIEVDAIAMGATFTFVVDTDGDFDGELALPTPEGTQTLPCQGSFDLIDQTTVTVSFTPEIPPLLTDFSCTFSLEDNELVLHAEETTFDFDDDGSEEPAIFDGTLTRS